MIARMHHLRKRMLVRCLKRSKKSLVSWFASTFAFQGLIICVGIELKDAPGVYRSTSTLQNWYCAAVLRVIGEISFSTPGFSVRASNVLHRKPTIEGTHVTGSETSQKCGTEYSLMMRISSYPSSPWLAGWRGIWLRFLHLARPSATSNA